MVVHIGTPHSKKTCSYETRDFTPTNLEMYFSNRIKPKATGTCCKICICSKLSHINLLVCLYWIFSELFSYFKYWCKCCCCTETNQNFHSSEMTCFFWDQMTQCLFLFFLKAQKYHKRAFQTSVYSQLWISWEYGILSAQS